MADGSKVVGELVGADTYSDLAVVKISSDKIKTVAEFADSTKLNVGEVAIAIGSPLGTQYANSVTQGIVSSLSRTVTLKTRMVRLSQQMLFRQMLLLILETLVDH